jgi:CBS domain containing-hemolysin-like protein
MLSLERLVYGAEPLVEDPSIHLVIIYLGSALLTLLGIVVGENIYKKLCQAKVS